MSQIKMSWTKMFWTKMSLNILIFWILVFTVPYSNALLRLGGNMPLKTDGGLESEQDGGRMERKASEV
jgi:hypothetical protein